MVVQRRRAPLHSCPVKERGRSRPSSDDNPAPRPPEDGPASGCGPAGPIARNWSRKGTRPAARPDGAWGDRPARPCKRWAGAAGRRWTGPAEVLDARRTRTDPTRPGYERPTSRFGGPGKGPPTGASSRAGDRTRTGDPHLGKVMLYQLSHARDVRESTEPTRPPVAAAGIDHRPVEPKPPSPRSLGGSSSTSSSSTVATGAITSCATFSPRAIVSGRTGSRLTTTTRISPR